jgi:hypothetical protein
MVRRILFGLLWFVVFWFAGSVLVGAIAGAIAGANNPANASQVGAIAGSNAVEALRLYILGGAVLMSAAGAWVGWLPGTERRTQL